MNIFYAILYRQICPSWKTWFDHSNTVFCFSKTNSFTKVLIDAKSQIKNNTNAEIFVYMYLYKYIAWYEKQKCYTMFVKDTNLKKYEFFLSLYENPFYGKETKTSILETFMKAQTHYHALNRFAYIWKIKRAPTSVSTDLCFNDLDPTEDCSFVLYQNHTKFWFEKIVILWLFA